VSISFRTPEIDDLGLAGYFRVVPSADAGGYEAVLFVMNAAGEPVEFCFADIETPRTVLWGQTALRRRVSGELVKSLLEACSVSPVILLSRADEIGPETFSEDVVVAVPSCRVASSLETSAVGIADNDEALPDSGGAQLLWCGDAPGQATPARRLLSHLSETGLVLEPFERAQAGLAEVKRSEPSPA